MSEEVGLVVQSLNLYLPFLTLENTSIPVAGEVGTVSVGIDFQYFTWWET